jgi:hypothetical protein
MDNLSIPVPKTSLEKLLKPINRSTDSCVLKTHKNLLYSVCTSDDKSVILYATCKLPIELESLKLNLISIKKLLNGLDCLGDDGEFKMILNKNHIRCQIKSSSSLDDSFFKYHLVEDGIITESTVNTDTISKLKFDTEFEIPLHKLKQILTAYSFATDASKIYFYVKEDKIFADIDDKTISNIDSMSMVITDNILGETLDNPIPVKLEVFKNLMSSKLPVKVKINKEFKVLVFHTKENNEVDLKYIVSALVK